MTQTPSAASRQLVCAGVLVMPIVYMVVAVGLRLAGVVQQEGFGEFDPQLTLILTGAFVAAGITTGAVSLVFKKAMLKNATAAEQRFTAVLESMAISEFGAVLGLMLILLSGNVLYGSLLCGISFAFTCFHFPGRHWLEHGDDLS